MGEIIALTAVPEKETTPERAYWDSFIGALNGIASMSSEVDMIETLSSMEEETEEDAAMLLYNYYLNITTDVGEQDDLQNTEDFLCHYGLLE